MDADGEVTRVCSGPASVVGGHLLHALDDDYCARAFGLRRIRGISFHIAMSQATNAMRTNTCPDPNSWRDCQPSKASSAIDRTNIGTTARPSQRCRRR